MKRTRPLLLGFLLAIVATICVAQTIRGPVISTPFSRTILDDTTAAAMRTTLGVTGTNIYTFDTGQFTITETSDVHMKNGPTMSNLVVKAAMTNDSLTASMAMVSDSSKKIISSATSLAELALLSGVTTRPAGTNVFESTQFDIRAAHIGVKDSAAFTNLSLKLITTFGSGAAATPSLAFAADSNTGFFTETPDTIGFGAGGAGLGNWDSTGLWPYTDSAIELGSSGRYWSSIYGDVHLAQGGFAAAPGFSWGPDTDTGFFRDTANVIKLATGGVQKWEWDASGHYVPFIDVTYDIGTSAKQVRDIFVEQVKLDDGTATNPALTFSSSTSHGFYRIGTGDIGIGLNGEIPWALWTDSGSTRNYITSDAGGGNPYLFLEEEDQGVDGEKWQLAVAAGTFVLSATSDNEATTSHVLYVPRTGANVDNIFMPLNATGEGLVVGSNGGGDVSDGRLHVITSANGDAVMRLEGESGGGLGDIAETTYMSRAETTDATVTTLHTVPITADRTYFIEATVTARRTGGAAGTADDGAVYILRAMVTTKSGTVTIDSVIATMVAEDVAAYACTLDVSTTNIRVRVTGVAATTIDWACKVTAQAQGL